MLFGRQLSEGVAYRTGWCEPEELYGVWLGAFDQFGDPFEYDLNWHAGYHMVYWKGVKVGLFRPVTVDVGLLMDLNTGDVIFFVRAETQEQAERHIKITSGYLDLPREEAQVRKAQAELARRAKIFHTLAPLFS